MALKSLQREYTDLMAHPVPFGTVAPTNDPLVWKAYLVGPEDSPYEGGQFELEMQFTGDYPARGPKLKFITSIFHANIARNGFICISLVSDWRPTDNMLTVMKAVSNLLAQPDRNNAYYGGNLTDQQYRDEAVRWTQTYAQKKCFN
ncbi:ubiquitin-conjugating enzyme E2 D4-like [Oppia nitens]|uniref:ubiquitin-conjugating enzyme E2 D4-like n=1 Tax=Oppia nitens TaxID=1686743 RepID=UPI0023DB8DF5|nr:ubiquitin-conjugating enzyme E2 D4-like [Oppia nitens]